MNREMNDLNLDHFSIDLFIEWNVNYAYLPVA